MATIPYVDRSMSMLSPYIYGEDSGDDASLTQYSRDAFDSGDFINSTSQKLDVSPDAISEFQLAAETSLDTEPDIALFEIPYDDVDDEYYMFGKRLRIGVNHESLSKFRRIIGASINGKPYSYYKRYQVWLNNKEYYGWHHYKTTINFRAYVNCVIHTNSFWDHEEYALVKGIISIKRNGIEELSYSFNEDIRDFQPDAGNTVIISDDDSIKYYTLDEIVWSNNSALIDNVLPTDVITIEVYYDIDVTNIKTLKWFFESPNFLKKDGYCYLYLQYDIDVNNFHNTIFYDSDGEVLSYIADTQGNPEYFNASTKLVDSPPPRGFLEWYGLWQDRYGLVRAEDWNTNGITIGRRYGIDGERDIDGSDTPDDMRLNYSGDSFINRYRPWQSTISIVDSAVVPNRTYFMEPSGLAVDELLTMSRLDEPSVNINNGHYTINYNINMSVLNNISYDLMVIPYMFFNGYINPDTEDVNEGVTNSTLQFRLTAKLYINDVLYNDLITVCGTDIHNTALAFHNDGSRYDQLFKVYVKDWWYDKNGYFVGVRSELDGVTGFDEPLVISLENITPTDTVRVELDCYLDNFNANNIFNWFVKGVPSGTTINRDVEIGAHILFQNVYSSEFGSNWIYLDAPQFSRQVAYDDPLFTGHSFANEDNRASIPMMIIKSGNNEAYLKSNSSFAANRLDLYP